MRSDIWIRVFLAIVAVLLMRDGYAGLRGVHLGVQTKGRSWLFLRGRTGRVAGGAFILLGALFLYFARSQSRNASRFAKDRS